MSWGIAETAPEIEKIKAESADYLGGLNSCGEIEWGIYSQAFDFYADLIQKAYELGKTEAKPHWIPATERLPEKEGEYLVTSVYHYYSDGRKTYKTTVDRWSRNGAGKEWVATSNDAHVAWMPFPTPFKVGKDDE